MDTQSKQVVRPIQSLNIEMSGVYGHGIAVCRAVSIIEELECKGMREWARLLLKLRRR